ncbi:MAG: T9SS type A sorting domain-containing protein [Saprospiraceae bacterium]|nr:T9SS type A sorting domain-containing protein [Saprospiraceae bacterium]
MRYLLIIFAVCFSFPFLNAQLEWKPTLTEPYYEVDDIAILPDNRYYISLRKTHEIFESRDSGANWNLIAPFDIKFNNLALKNLEVVREKLYIGLFPLIQPTAFYELTKNGVLTKIREGNHLFSDATKMDQEGNLFAVEGDNVYSIDSNLRFDRNKLIFSAYNTIQSFFYTEENNFLVAIHANTRPDTVRIYKFNSRTGDYLLHSKYHGYLTLNNILVSENGSVLYRNHGSEKIFAASYQDPLKYNELIIDPSGQLTRIYNFSLTANGEVFIVANSGVYMCDGIHLDQWYRCEQMSQNLSLPNEDEVNNYYSFKDSLSALISYGTICGASRVYCFSPKYKNWKEVILDIKLENLIDLKTDFEGRLYGMRPCDGYGWTKTRYLVSNDEGKTWDYLKVFGYEVNGLAINKEGNAVAITLNKEVNLYNPLTKSWDNIITSHLIKPRVKLYHCYSIGQDLILEGIDEGVSLDKPVFYYSEDGGRNWKTTSIPLTFINKFLPSIETNVDQGNNWMISKSQYNSGGIRNVIYSPDKGMIWQEDDQFKDFIKVYELVPLKDDQFLVSATSKDPKYNKLIQLFLVDSSGAYTLFHPDFERSSWSIKVVDQDFMLAYPRKDDYPVAIIEAKDNTLLHRFSSSGLGHSEYDSWAIKSGVVTSDKQVFLSLAMDGIYTNTKEIFTSVYNSKSGNSLSLHTSLSNNFLQLSQSEEGLVEIEEYSIFSILGSVVEKNQWQGNDELISINKLTPGVYFLLITDKQKNFHSFKFVKY